VTLCGGDDILKLIDQYIVPDKAAALQGSGIERSGWQPGVLLSRVFFFFITFEPRAG
jgi:hypothetical protein